MPEFLTLVDMSFEFCAEVAAPDAATAEDDCAGDALIDYMDDMRLTYHQTSRGHGATEVYEDLIENELAIRVVGVRPFTRDLGMIEEPREWTSKVERIILGILWLLTHGVFRLRKKRGISIVNQIIPEYYHDRALQLLVRD